MKLSSKQLAKWRKEKKQQGWKTFYVFGPEYFIVALQHYAKKWKRDNWHLWIDDDLEN